MTVATHFECVLHHPFEKHHVILHYMLWFKQHVVQARWSISMQGMVQDVIIVLNDLTRSEDVLQCL